MNIEEVKYSMKTKDSRRRLKPSLIEKQQTRQKKLQNCSESCKGFVAKRLIKNNLVCLMDILSEQFFVGKRKRVYKHQVILHNGKPEILQRRMSETGNYLMGWPTHNVEGHDHYTVEDWALKMSLDIILENQRMCICCDEN